jgi:dihydroorotate dehydrogenase (NAD+) catalytic subunit
MRATSAGEPINDRTGLRAGHGTGAADLTTVLAGMPLPNPVLAAAGCIGAGPEIARFTDLAEFGAVVTRSVTEFSSAGLPTPRLAETPGGLLNALGLPGVGMDAFLAVELPWLLSHDVTPIVSIVADTVAEFGRLAGRLRQVPGVAGIEVNLSSPVHGVGVLPFATDASGSAAVIHAVRRNSGAAIPIFAKLSGDIADTVAVARACLDAGATGLSLINAIRGLDVDTGTRKVALGSHVGGLSGPAIRPVALRTVWEVRAGLGEVPIIASGGISDGASALAMIMAGATTVALGTVLLHDPRAGHRIIIQLSELIQQQGLLPAELVGIAHA